MRTIAALLGVGLFVFGFVGVSYAPYHTQAPKPTVQAQAGDLKAQLNTAITHAGFAGGGDTLAYAQTHLGHVLNCIEGTKGKNFNQSWGHVCQGQGNGILVDLKAASGGTAFTLVAESADALAVAGEKTKDLAQVKNAAKGAGVLLTVIAENLK